MRTGTILPANAETIREAGALLASGALVAFPTETVYGLGADATSGPALERLYRAKGRPRFNPLICHLASREAALALARHDARAEALAAAFWPGPLTLVLPRGRDCPVSERATAGLDTIALRVPAHALARALAEALGRPLAAPSANPSGGLSPTTAAHVAAGLGDACALILDGGPSAYGVESTVVGLGEGAPRLLRPGAVPRAAIEAVTGPLEAPEPGPISAPGQLLAHYAPRTPLRLEATSLEPGEALLAFGPPLQGSPAAMLNLSPGGDVEEAAGNLFAHLHRLDALGLKAIAVMRIPALGLGEAINDRLARAARGRG